MKRTRFTLKAKHVNFVIGVAFLLLTLPGIFPFSDSNMAGTLRFVSLLSGISFIMFSILSTPFTGKYITVTASRSDKKPGVSVTVKLRGDSRKVLESLVEKGLHYPDIPDWEFIATEDTCRVFVEAPTTIPDGNSIVAFNNTMSGGDKTAGFGFINGEACFNCLIREKNRDRISYLEIAKTIGSAIEDEIESKLARITA